ncbi:MAG TPA: hypothetical protein VF506_00440 [Streptosporangiaceae bacterium]
MNRNDAIEALGSLVSRAGGEGDEALDVFKDTVAEVDRLQAESLVRIAPEILARLEAGGSEPVHVVGVERHDDGTLDLVFRTVDLHIKNDRLRLALEAIANHDWVENCLDPQRAARIAKRALEVTS